MFRFSFFNNRNATDEEPELSETVPSEWFESKEIQPYVEFAKATDHISLFKCQHDIVLKYFTEENLCYQQEECSVLKADKNESDLITRVYEGGNKIWECTYDLVNYILSENIDFKNKNVLDLGCGIGIIGILAFTSGARTYFQDYNEEVLVHRTIPNVFLNEALHSKICDDCKFYSGDWSSFLSVTEEHIQSEADKFDYIFTCETIYNPQNYRKLHAVFKERLKQSGVIYLAAKTHYFGVGGGLRQFEELMMEENVFNFCTCWKQTDGLQREILKITFKKPTA